MDRGHGGRFGHFIGGAFTGPGQGFSTKNPASGEELARITQGTAGRCRYGRRGRRPRLPALVAALGHQRARHLYALARLLQKHSRLFAVLETLDNGKPIRESRDIDIPLAQRHFYYHAGLAQLRDAELPGHEPLGRLRAGGAVEFPAADAVMEDRPGAGGGQHGGAETGRIYLADRAALRRYLPRGGAAQGRRQHRHRRWRDRRGAGRSSRRGKGGLHRLDRGGAQDPAGDGGQRQGADAGAGRQVALHRLRRRRYRFSAIEGLVDAIWFNAGQVCCAGSPPSGAGKHRRRISTPG